MFSAISKERNISNIKEIELTSVPTILMAIPIHVLADAEIGEGDPITFTAETGRIIIEKINESEVESFG